MRMPDLQKNQNYNHKYNTSKKRSNRYKKG